MSMIDPNAADPAFLAPLGEILSRAAAPGERCTGSSFEPDQDPAADAAAERFFAEWLRIVGGGDREAFSRLLEDRGIGSAEADFRCRRVRLRDDAEIPVWGQQLVELLRLWTPCAGIAPFRVAEVAPSDAHARLGAELEEEWAHHRYFAPLLGGARQHLREVLATSRLEVTASAERGMLAHLARRWNVLTSPTLLHRIREEDIALGQSGEVGATVRSAFFTNPRTTLEEWVTLFQSYPLMARLLGVVFGQWRHVLAEFLERASRDLEQLECVFAAGGELGSITRFEADRGDAHQHGRTVAHLEFSSGVRLLYKPKDLRIAVAYDDLIQELNGVGLQPALHTRRMLAREGYLWDEFISPTTCTDATEVRRYYIRLGMHARLLQLLEGTDFIAENVLPHGEYPVLVDLETLLSPRGRLREGASALERTLASEMEDTPFRSGLVTTKIVGDAGKRPLELGALAPRGEQWVPFEGGPMSSVTNTAIPRLEGTAVDPADYFPDVVFGYRQMFALLREHAAFLLREGGPLRAMASLPVRFLYRPTHLYARILEESLQLNYLRDGASREVRLERLFRASFRDSIPAPVIQSEIDALRDFDIPYFSARPDSDAIFLRDGRPVEGFFNGCAWERLSRRLSGLSTRSEGAGVDLLRTALFIADPGALPAPIEGETVPAPPVPGERWTEAAVEIGDSLLRQALHPTPGALTWLGLNYHPPLDLWRYGPLRPDLLTGSAGLAVVFAELFHATGGERFRAAGDVLLRHLRRSLEEQWALEEYGRRPSTGGAFHGWSAWAYAGARTARLLGDTVSERAVLDYAERLFRRAAMMTGPTDVLSGGAGALLAMYGAMNRKWDGLCDPAVKVARALRSKRNSAGEFPRPQYPVGPTLLDSLPIGDAGIELALLRVGELDELVALSAAGRSLGDRIAYLGAARALPDVRDGALAAANAYLATVPTVGARDDLLDRAELALMAWQVSRGDRELSRATELGARVLHRRKRTGRWFPGGWAADRHYLSAVHGTGAIALLFLGLAQPTAFRCLRLLD